MESDNIVVIQHLTGRSMLTKALILDQIKKRGLAIVQGEQEVEYFGKIFARVRERDYQGLLDLSHSHPEELRAVL